MLISLSLFHLQRWRRRWFVLQQGKLPRQYVLNYYTDETKKRLKGTIPLDDCQQVRSFFFPMHINVFGEFDDTEFIIGGIRSPTNYLQFYYVDKQCNVCRIIKPFDVTQLHFPLLSTSIFSKVNVGFRAIHDFLE